jgi:hypothetical protein
MAQSFVLSPALLLDIFTLPNETMLTLRKSPAKEGILTLTASTLNFPIGKRSTSS